jgi:predicted lipoprotein
MHGTNSGYAAHRRFGDDVCDPCRKAHNEYVNNNYHGATEYAKKLRALRLLARAKAQAEISKAHKAEFRAAYQRWLTTLTTEAKS